MGRGSIVGTVRADSPTALAVPPDSSDPGLSRYDAACRAVAAAKSVDEVR
jgi:hypothetical protein